MYRSILPSLAAFIYIFANQGIRQPRRATILSIMANTPASGASLRHKADTKSTSGDQDEIVEVE
jgi:hypothetical protein